jgi:hypothetical protein
MRPVITNHQAKIIQTAKVLSHLQRYGSISTLEARELGIMHPAGRIKTLRERGNIIETRADRIATTPNSVAPSARYHLIKEGAGDEE